MERFKEWTAPEIENGKLTKWNWMVQSKEGLQLGKYVDVGAFCYINAKYGVEIQDEVQIGSHTSIYSESTIDEKQGKVTLKKNCRIGSHCTVMPGVTIGENALIGAHSFVNKNIPDNAVAFGAPAQLRKNLSKKDPAVWKIPLFKTYSDQEDIDAVTAVIKRGTYWAIGPEIFEFEQKIAALVDRKYAVAFNSGTSALHALLVAHDIQGKEVIIPSFTFIATANAVILAGGIPIFAECEEETFGLDLEDVKKKITPNTIAVMPIHYGGCAARDSEKIQLFCKERKLLLLEDAAQSFSAGCNGQKVGALGEGAIFSLCQNKIITSGEGGIAVTDSEQIYEKMKLLRSHGRVETGNDYFSNTKDNDYIKVGYNSRISSMAAALGISQLKKMAWLIEKRKQNAAHLHQRLGNLTGIRLPLPPRGFDHFYQMYTIVLESPQIRDELQNFLGRKGIMTKVYFNPVHLKTLYRQRFGYKEGDLPKTESLSLRVLTLPLFVNMTSQELEFIVNSICEFFIMQGGKR